MCLQILFLTTSGGGSPRCCHRHPSGAAVIQGGCVFPIGLRSRV